MRLPYMPFFVADFLSSPKVGAMTAAEVGAYCLLLMHCWTSGDVSLPSDDESLAMMSKLGSGWKKAKAKILENFQSHPSKPSFLSNAKLNQVWEEAVERHERRASAGRKSGHSRRTKLEQCSNNVQAMFEHSSNREREQNANILIYSNTQTVPSEQKPPSPLESGRLEAEPDWLVIEAEFLRRWDSLAGVAKAGTNAMPNNVVRRFRELWREPGWWKRADAAMTKLKPGLQNGVRISLRNFIDKDTTIGEILGGVHDFSKDKRSSGPVIGPGDRYDPSNPIKAEDFER